MKKIVSALLMFIIVLSVLSSLPLAVSAESLYIRKIVSVVYDDSGSMVGANSAYAHYAMQAFCGMLNSEDQLFITYMRNSSPEKIDLSAGGIQKSVDSIREHTDGGSTPYTSVEIAYNKLKSVNDSNPNTQYWLVVITDGDFDECVSKNKADKKRFLNDHFNEYTKGVMPNGTTPQVTFLGIGDVASPDEDHAKGIYTYAASDAKGIIGAMDEMADRISGRTRLQKNDIKKLDDKTIQVSSSIPLLNIAVFGQGSKAQITKARENNEKDIPISRKVSISIRDTKYPDLVGGAYLLGDSQNVIGSGTYIITFDQAVDLDEVVILFEPALETRMTITVNGKEISDYNELDNLMEGDKISVSCKIYEMGTDTEIDSSLLPPGTKYEITVSESGKQVKKIDGQNMLLSEYVLKNIETEISGAVVIEGFNPIDYSVKFTPAKYVPKTVYTIKPSFGSNVKSVKLDTISSNKDLSVCFTVYADGVAMTDPSAVKALNPSITVSPQGNSGNVEYANDGKIIFTPKAAAKPTSGYDNFDVNVTCTIADGTTASSTYTVELPVYSIKAEFGSGTQSVKYDEISNNKDLSIIYTVYKDGVAITDPAAVKSLNPSIVIAPLGNDGTVEYSNDGKILFTPKAALKPDSCNDKFDVNATCTIANGASATLAYSVVLPVYSISADFGSGTQSVKFDDISNNKDLTICFTVYKDGVLLTDPDAVKMLNPVFDISPYGNDGTVTYSDDGKIIFTPTVAAMPVEHDGRFTVDVKCTIDGGLSAVESYTVMIAEYLVIAIEGDETLKKTQFFGNDKSVSFYITKDGVKMDKNALGQQFSVSLNESQASLKYSVEVSADGVITVTPYSEEEHILTFWNWWINWAYYFGLEGDDVVVTLSHSVGTASATIDIVEEDVGYQLLNVYLPLIIEIAIVLYLIWWIYAICAKPKFLPGAVLYIAELSYGGKRGNRYHEIDKITEVNLKQYNSLKHRMSPTLKAKKHYVGKNLTISAGYGGSIICHSEVWYKGDISPKDNIREDLGHPQYVKTYIDDHDSLKIQVISAYDGDDVHAEESIDNPNPELYYVHTDMANIATINGIQVIDKGTIFAYAIRLNN